MTTFIIFAVALVLLAVGLLLPPLLRREVNSGIERSALNVAIFKERLAELEQDLENEILEPAQFEQAKTELEQSLLVDVTDEDAAGGGAVYRQTKWPLAVVALALPLFAGVFYWQWGSWELIGMNPAQQRQVSQQQEAHDIQGMVRQLETRLEQNPDDPQGWFMLGRTYLATDQAGKAVPAFAKAYALAPDNPEVLLAYAEAQAVAGRGNLSGPPRELIQRALRLDPNSQKGRWMAGIAAYQAGEAQAAIDHWTPLLDAFPAGSQQGDVLREYLAMARSQAGVEPPAQTPAAGTAAGLQVQVRLADSLAAQVSPEDTLFVFARPTSGQRMPVAIVRKRAGDLPLTVTLDDSQAMMPQMRLSNFEQVQVGARISKSGDATPQPGDLQGLKAEVSVGAGQVELVIDRKL